MNRLLVRSVLLFAFIFVGGAGFVQAQAPKLAFINSQQIMAQAPGTAEAQAAFEQDMQRYQAELQQLETELRTMQDEFERQQATLTAAVRQERTEAIQQKYIAYQQRQQELEMEAQERQAQLVGPIMQRIEGVIEQLRTEGSYSFIFDVAGGSGIISADPALDITAQVLERLRAQPAPETP